MQVRLDCQHAAHHHLADAQQDPGHAAGLLPQPEEDAGDQPAPPAHQGAPAPGGGQPGRHHRQEHGRHDVQHGHTQVHTSRSFILF